MCVGGGDQLLKYVSCVWLSQPTREVPLPSFVVECGSLTPQIPVCYSGEARGCGGAVFLGGKRATSLVLGRVDGLVDTADQVSLTLMSQWPVLSWASLVQPSAGGDYNEEATRVSWKTHPSVPCLPSESPGGAAAGSLGLAVVP